MALAHESKLALHGRNHRCFIVLDSRLLMVARRFLPPSPADALHLGDCAISSDRPRSTSGHPGRLDRRNHDGRAPCTGRIVDGDRVVGRIRGDSRDVVVDGLDQLDARRRVIDRRLGERVREDHTGLNDAHMQLLSASRATASMFRHCPFTLSENRQASAVDDEMKTGAPGVAPQYEVEVLTALGQRRVTRRPQVESHQREERREKALCLTEWQMEEKTEREGGLDRKV
jgi:hypothetical protein